MFWVFYELIIIDHALFAYPLNCFRKSGGVNVRRLEIGCVSFHVRAVICAANGFVALGAAPSAVDDDRAVDDGPYFFECLGEQLQTVFEKRGRVVVGPPRAVVRLNEFRQFEIWCEAFARLIANFRYFIHGSSPAGHDCPRRNGSLRSQRGRACQGWWCGPERSDNSAPFTRPGVQPLKTSPGFWRVLLDRLQRSFWPVGPFLVYLCTTDTAGAEDRWVHGPRKGYD